MKIKGIIFDLDGVICSTDKYHYEAWLNLANKEGIYFDEKINDRLRGISRMASLEIILEKSTKAYTLEEKEEMAEYKNELYKSLLNNMTTDDLSCEVKCTLDYLRNKGYLLAIGSSSKNAPLILKQLGLDNYFDAVSDGNNIINTKPDPEVFLKAANYLGLRPEECIVVEDAKAGIDAAKAANMFSVAVGNASLLKCGDENLNSFSELQNINVLI